MSDPTPDAIRGTNERQSLTPEEYERTIRMVGKALAHYADERSWLNRGEFRTFPGHHAREVASGACAALVFVLDDLDAGLNPYSALAGCSEHDRQGGR